MVDIADLCFFKFNCGAVAYFNIVNYIDFTISEAATWAVKVFIKLPIH